MAGIKDMLSKGVASVNMKTSNFMEINKIKTYINNLNEEIVNLKKTIGEKTYNMWSANNFSMSVIEPELNKIAENYKEISNQEQKISSIEEETNRILGNYANNADMAAGGMPDGQIICNACGFANRPESKFCVSCGNQIQ